MNLDRLKALMEEYGGDIKRMEMEEHLKAMPKLEDVMEEKELLKLAEAARNDFNQNPLSMYSTSELKKELRRRKGK